MEQGKEIRFFQMEMISGYFMDTLKWIPGRLQTPKISHNLRLGGLFLIALVEGFFNSKKMKSQKSKMESPNTWMGAIK